MSIISVIYEEMTNDCDDESELLERLYENATEDQKKVIDNVLLCVCGWTFATLKDLSERG